jgi:intein/homing endonuclease
MPNWMPGSEFYVDFHHGDPFCVSEKTPILQETGYTKAANVEVGSLIYTHKGNWLPVKRKIKRALRKQEKAYSITLSGVKDVPLEFSEEHPLLIRRLYQCSFASSALCRPPVRNTNNFCDGKEICFSKKWLNNESIFLPVSECLVGDYVLYPIPQEGNLQQITITFKERLAPRSPETIKSENLHITSEFCWVLGLYLAEGSTAKSIKGKPQRLLFSMSIDEIDVLERVNRIILEKFGKEGSIKTKDNQAELVISSTKIAQIFDSLCPGNLYDKKIPNFIYSCSTSCRVSYLLGAYLGDGTVQRTELRYECANEKLVLDLRRLSFALGIPATYSNRDRIDKRTGVETRSFLTTIHIFNLLKYDISWLMYKQYKIIREFPRLPNINNFSDEQYIYQRITSITPISIDYVYGFEVDNDDSFCCFDFATHNTKIEMGEARLPGESYETVRSVAPVTPGEADLLGTTSEEAMGYYSGDIESIIPRYKWNDKIEQRKKLLIDSLKAQGSLIREQGIVYDTSKNITAYADATYRNDDGEIVPVKFAPYLGKEGGFLAGSASSLNAYLTLSGTRKGLLIGIDETGNTTQAIIFRDSERYEREAENDLQVRMRSYQELAKRRARGEPTAPGMHYSHMDRLKILSDVAYYSNQYKNELKIVKTQIKSGILGEQEALEVEDIENKVEKLKQKFLFIEDRFGGGEALTPEAQRRRDDVDSRYNAVERTIGKLWQDITTMRNPIISKLIGNRTALQAYQDDVVYGRAFKEWSSPIESYVKPFYQQMAVSSNPIQGALSGATAGFLMGGPLGAAVGGFGGTAWSLTGAQFMDHGSYIPGDIKKQRQIMAAADIAERDRYQMLYEQTGYNEYLYRMRNTIAGAMELNQPMTSGRMISVANKPERMYMKGILDDLNTENLQEARALLPQNISALLDRNVGIRGDVRPEDYTGGYFVESGDVVNTQVPIEDIVVKTMQLEGLNAKDVGLGWQRTLRRMNTMKEVGIEAPAMYQRNLPKRKIEYTIAPAQIKKVLDGILREYNPSITVHSGDGPLEVVVEIV